VGWTVPVLVDEGGGIIAGHGRVLAAHQLGVTEVPVMVARGWSKAQKQAYVLADNKLTLNAGWNDALLRVELADLADMGFDLSLTGFGEQELAALSASGVGLIDPDEAAELPAHPISEPGDVWLLGRHRLVCGDSIDADTVAKALHGIKPHLMVTDPPYGVEYDPNWRNEAIRAKPYGTRAVGKVQNDEQADWRAAWALFPGDVAYVWHDARRTSLVQASIEHVGFTVRCQIIWAKPRHVISRGDYHWQHEPCWYAVRKNKRGHWSGDRSQTTLWEIEHLKSETGHGTQKPVECMKRPIENNSSPGQAVYDPFLGSGTTIIAAEITDRACHAIEISPGYVDVAVLRWQAFTGLAATIEGDGRAFDEIAEQRGREAA
jgi:DNA modification methylase